MQFTVTSSPDLSSLYEQINYHELKYHTYNDLILAFYEVEEKHILNHLLQASYEPPRHQEY